MGAGCVAQRCAAQQPFRLPVVLLAPLGGAGGTAAPPPGTTVRCWVLPGDESSFPELHVSQDDMRCFADHARSQGVEPGAAWECMLKALARRPPSLDEALARHVAVAWA